MATNPRIPNVYKRNKHLRVFKNNQPTHQYISCRQQHQSFNEGTFKKLSKNRPFSKVHLLFSATRMGQEGLNLEINNIFPANYMSI